MSTSAALSGIYNILVTPFTGDGNVDVASIKSLVEAVLSTGVDGVTALGVAGEAHKLTYDEKVLVAREVLAAVNGRVPVIVGASYPETSDAISVAREMSRYGAAGLMIAPPNGAFPG